MNHDSELHTISERMRALEGYDPFLHALRFYVGLAVIMALWLLVWGLASHVPADAVDSDPGPSAKCVISGVCAEQDNVH